MRRLLVLLLLLLLPVPAHAAWLCGWSHRQTVTVEEEDNENLVNYQVRVNVPWTAPMQTGFDDLRFTLDDEITLVDHWVERVESGTRAIVWVEVPFLPARGTLSLYLYYGNPTAAGASDGPATWIFFDDGSSGWNNYGTGSVTPATVAGVVANRKQGDDDPNGAWKSLGATLGNDFRLLARDGRLSSDSHPGDWNQYGLEDNLQRGYGFRREAAANGNGGFGIERRDPQLRVRRERNEPQFFDRWYVTELTRSRNRLTANLYADDRNRLNSVRRNDNRYSTFTRMVVRGDRHYYLDWIAVGSYVRDEPSVALSNPENLGCDGLITGRVFEDVVGDGLPGGQSIGDPLNPGVAGVTVYLYADGGDNAPDGFDDTLLDSTATSATGAYSLSGAGHWVVVNSRTVTPAQGFAFGGNQGQVWAEQTYGPIGGRCADDDGLRGATALTAPGSCFGGRRGHVSDRPYSLAGAEHVALVDTTLVPTVDFGFSFNVVTDVRDGLDDDASATRTVQGSLRQFLNNANAVASRNAMRFVPAVSTNSSGLGGSWWQVDLGSALPVFREPFTTLDGTAHSYADGLTIRDTNPGLSGHSGEPVGAGNDGVEGTGDEFRLPDYRRPELEIDGNDTGRMFQVAADNTVVTRIAAFDNADFVFDVQDGTGSEIRDCFLGPRASGTDPGPGQRIGRAANIFDGEADVVGNRIAHVEGTGVMVGDASVIRGNDLERIALSNSVGDGISVELTRGEAVSVIGNRVEIVSAYGIESWQAPGPFVIDDNTVIECGIQAGQGETGGIRVFGSGSRIRRNLAVRNAGSGIVVTRGSGPGVGNGNLLSRNVTYDNALMGIDLDNTTVFNPNGDGVTANDGLFDPGQQNRGVDYPIITYAIAEGDTLKLEGYVGTETSRLPGPFTVELYKVDDDGGQNGEGEVGDGQSYSHGEGRFFVGSFSMADGDTFNVAVPIPAAVNFTVGDLVVGMATDAANNTSELGVNRTVITDLPDIVVTKTASTVADPVNGLANPKAIPGATVLYELRVTNAGPGAADSVMVTDAIPANTALFVGDVSGPGSGPVVFLDGSVASGLNYSYIAPGNPADDVEFSSDGGLTYAYAPSAPFDPNVTHVRVRPTGTFARSNGVSHPSFALRLRVRVD